MLNQSNEISILKSDNRRVGTELLSLIEEIQVPVNFAAEENKQAVELRSTLEVAQTNQRNNVKAYENDEDRYEILRRFGYTLEKISNLLDEASFDFSSLSMLELGEQLEKLVRTRKINTNQISYNFYQDLFSSTTDSLLLIEEGFQNGNFTSAEALEQVKFLKHDFESNVNDIPLQFGDSKNDVLHLLNMYEEAYSQEKVKTSGSNLEVSHSIDEQTKIELEGLNAKTKEIQVSTQNLFVKVSSFEPIVKLDGLTKQLKETDSFFHVENWNIDQASTLVADLDSTTNKLFAEQQIKNHEKEDLSSEITALVSETKKLDNITRQQIASRTYQSANARINKILNKLPKLNEMLEGNSPIPENLASQIGYCYDSIVSYDEEICFEIASKTELIPNEFDENLSSLTRDELYALQNHIKELSEERSPKLHPNTDDEEQTNQ